MTLDYEYPDPAMIDRARNGIAAVRASLANEDRGRWAVYAIRAVEVHEDEWVLYVVSARTSLPLTRDMAAALALERIWLSGRVQARLLPVDLTRDAPGTTPVSMLEVLVVVAPPGGGEASGRRDASSMATGVIDAREAGGVRLTIALPHPPNGWPR